MRANFISTFLCFSTVFFSLSISGQERVADFSSSLSIEQIVAQLKEKNLYPSGARDIAVAGQVLHSRLIQFKSPLSLQEALAICGGLMNNANRAARIIRRDSDGKYNQEILVDLKTILSEKEPYLLQSGDLVILPADKTKYRNKLPDFLLPIKIPTNQV